MGGREAVQQVSADRQPRVQRGARRGRRGMVAMQRPGRQADPIASGRNLSAACDMPVAALGGYGAALSEPAAHSVRPAGDGRARARPRRCGPGSPSGLGGRGPALGSNRGRRAQPTGSHRAGRSACHQLERARSRAVHGLGPAWRWHCLAAKPSTALPTRTRSARLRTCSASRTGHRHRHRRANRSGQPSRSPTARTACCNSCPPTCPRSRSPPSCGCRRTLSRRTCGTYTRSSARTAATKPAVRPRHRHAPSVLPQARDTDRRHVMAYGHAERNLAVIRRLEAETRLLLMSLNQPDAEPPA